MKNKKIISVIMSAVMMLSAASAVFAEEQEKITVTVNDRLIYFKDQEPVISENNDTLIPLRGVLEAMGADVDWNGEERSVYVKANDNITRLKLFLDNPIITKYTLVSITAMDSEEITATTAPTLMNERTMIPLRIVSENLGADVHWDDETRHITIKTKEYNKFIANNTSKTEESSEETVYNPKENLPYLYIEADKTEAKAGDRIKVDLKLANSYKIEKASMFTGLTATVFYDASKMSVVSQTAVVNGVETKNTLGAANDSFKNDSLKYVYIIMPTDTDIDKTLSDGTVASFVFEVTDESAAEFALSNRITDRGNDTAILVSDDDNNSRNIQDYDELYIDTTPVFVNGK